MFKVIEDMDNFLKEDPKNVVAVHCMAGKGRTGTVICAYLLTTSLFWNVESAIAYTRIKRFS